MPITFGCPGCSKQFKVPDEMAGRQSRCTQCGTPLVVPASQAAVAAWQPAPQPVPPAMTASAPYEVVAAAQPSGGRLGFLKNKMVLFGAAGVLGIIMLGAVGWGGYKLLFSGPGLGEEAKYLPDRCHVIASLRPEQIINSDAYKDIKKEAQDAAKSSTDPEKEFEQTAGIPLSNMQQVVFGVTTAGADSDYVAVVKTTKAVTADEIKSKKGGPTPQETKVKDITIYESYPLAWCVPDSQLVVYGKSDTLKKVLERGKAAELTEGMRSALKYADFSKSVAVAMDVKDAYAKSKEAPRKGLIDLDKIWDQIGIANPMGDVEASAYQIEIGKDIKIQSVLLCKDSRTAQDMKTISDGMAVFLKRMFPKYGGETFESWESSVSGARLTGTMTVKTESVVKFIKAMKELGKNASSTFTTVGQPLGPPR